MELGLYTGLSKVKMDAFNRSPPKIISLLRRLPLMYGKGERVIDKGGTWWRDRTVLFLFGWFFFFLVGRNSNVFVPESDRRTEACCQLEC